MLELIVWLLAAGLTVGVVAIAISWDDILISLKGKKIAVLGARGVGKTHFISFLSTGSIPEDYQQTLEPKKADQRRFQMKELDLKIKDMIDVSGGQDAYGLWKDQFKKAEIVFYLFRTDKLLLRESSQRVLDDISHIKDWMNEVSPKPLLFLVGTHCDLITEYKHLSNDKRGDYKDNLMSNDTISQLKKLVDINPQTLILGSMENEETTQELVYRLFYQIQNIMKK